MAHVKVAAFVWMAVYILRVDGSAFWAAVCGGLAVRLVEEAAKTGRVIRRTWRGDVDGD